jgi:hypothetical protein
MWRIVVIVEEDQRNRYKYSILKCTIYASRFYRLQNASDCGRKGRIREKKKVIYNDNDEIRVVGGTDAGENEIPWHVAMLRRRKMVGTVVVRLFSVVIRLLL